MVLHASSMAEVARGSTVSLWDGEEFLGSGFFIEPHLVATCAHVVWRRPDAVVVRWSGHALAGRVVVRRPAEHGGGDYYEHPDVAFVSVAGAPDHPVGRLADTVAVPDQLVAYGFSDATPHAGVHPDTLRLTVVGRSGQFLRLKDDEIVDGMSGSPAVDERTGLVYGLVKASRDYGAARGGWIVQATDVALVRADSARALGPPAAPPRPALRPAPGSPLHTLLMAQRRAAERLPYRLVEGPAPRLSTVYVRQRTAARQRQGRERAVTDVLRRHRHTLVVGGPGAGKSALVQHIVAETAGWWLDGANGTPAPYGPALALRVPATALQRRRPWLELLAEAVEADLADHLDHGLDPETLDPAATPGIEWLLLVDGLDEVYDRDHRQRLIDALGNRVAEYGSSWRFLVTSRPLFGQELAGLRAYLPEQAAQARFGDYELRHFDPPALARFVRAWFAVRTPDRVEQNVTTFLDEIEERRLDQLVRVPLLATIAAAVFEDHPDRPLPMSRTGLYARFVDSLAFARQRRADLRRALADQLAGHGPAAAAVVEALFDHTEEWLEEVAHRRLSADEETATATLAEDWLRREHGARVPDLARHLRTVLLGTGLLTVAGDDLRFIHRGFAEYLAAGYSVRRDWDSRGWLRRVRRDGISNLDMFRLARWTDAGNDPTRVLHRLLRPRVDAQRPFLRHPRLLDFCTILRDGLPLPDRSVDALVGAGFRAVRRIGVRDEAALPALTYALRCLHSRSPGPDRLVRLANDRRAAPVKRIAAARALAATGAHRAAVEALAAILSGTGSLWAAYTLALIADGADRDRATAHLLRAVAASSDPEERARAAVFLSELGLGPSADLALLVRAVSPAHTEEHRAEAIQTLRLTGPTGQTPMAELLDAVRRHLRPSMEQVRPGTEPAVWRLANDASIHDLAEGAVRLAEHRPDETRRILTAALVEGTFDAHTARFLAGVMSVRGHQSIAGALDPPPEPAAEVDPAGLAARAIDPGESPHDRRVAAEALAGHGEPDTAAWLWMAWQTDPTVPTVLKIEAVLDLARYDGLYDLAHEILQAHAGNRELPRRDRVLAWLGGVALHLDDLTWRLNDLPTGAGYHAVHTLPAIRTDPEQVRRLTALHHWIRAGDPQSTDAIARAAAAAHSPTVAAAVSTVEKLAEPTPAPVTLADAWAAMRARAETLRLVLPAGLDSPDWSDPSLAASLGTAAATAAEAALVRVLDDPGYALRQIERAGPALRCPWYARLADEAFDPTGARAVAALALAVALRDTAQVQGRRAVRRDRLQRLLGWRAPILGLVGDARNIVFALAAAYVLTFAGAAATHLLEGGPADPAGIAAVQTQLAVPLLVLAGCLLVRPARPPVSGRRIRHAVWVAGAAAAYLAQSGVDTRIPVPSWLAVEDTLRHAAEAVPVNAYLLGAAGVVMLGLTAWVPLLVIAPRPPGRLRTLAKAALAGYTIWWLLPLTLADVHAALDALP